MAHLTPDPIDPAPLLAAAQRPEAGAVVLFLGITREFTAGRQTRELTYEAHAPLALAELERLERKAREAFGLVDCQVVHRTGPVPLADASVAVVTSAPHRSAAFEGGAWLLDALKQSVPIWKQESYADGTTEWVHPAGAPRAGGGP